MEAPKEMKMNAWDYHPDPIIDAQVRAEVLEGDMADLAVGYPARWWVCPSCGRSHQRGYFLGFGQHRCLNCGYVGEHGTIHTNRPPATESVEFRDFMDRARDLMGMPPYSRLDNP